MRENKRKKTVFALLVLILLVTLSACKQTEPDQIENETQILEEVTEPAVIDESDNTQGKTEEENIASESTEIESTESQVENSLENAVYQLAKEWRDAFCKRDVYILIEVYAGDSDYQQLEYVDRYNSLETMLFAKFHENWSLNWSDCQMIFDEDSATIWYYAEENQQEAVVIRQDLNFGEVQGRLKIEGLEQTIFNQVDNSAEYEQAYLIDNTPSYYDFYSNLCDEVILKQGISDYLEAGTAAVHTLNLTGGEVKEIKYVDVTTDLDSAQPYTAYGQAAEVNYEFADGTSVVIPMYKTYNGVWFPGDEGSSSRYINSDFMKFTEADYENAVDTQSVSNWYGIEGASLYLLADLGTISIYGTSTNYMILVENQTIRPYDVSWTSPLSTLALFTMEDFDEDGVDEIACSAHLGTGTGVSVDSLYLFERSVNDVFRVYEYTSDAYLRDLKRYFMYTYIKDNDTVCYYVNGRRTAYTFQFQEEAGEIPESEAALEFEQVTMGSFVSFEVGDALEMEVQLEVMDKNRAQAVYCKGALTATVIYYGDGEFYLTDCKLISDDRSEDSNNRGVTAVQDGTSYSIDLNGDGNKEELLYERIPSKEDPEFYSEPKLTINGKVYDADMLMELGVYLYNYDSGEWYLMDLDTNDDYKEIALFDAGPSNDPVTYFLRFDGTQLIFCGAVADCPQADSFVVHGDGTVSAMQRLSILQTWWADTTWKLNESNILEEEVPEWYYPYLWGPTTETHNYFLQDTKLYTEPSLDASTVDIPQGTEIYLTATDDKEWVQVTTEDWVVGWFYMEDYDTIRFPDHTADVFDAMNYLCMAD